MRTTLAADNALDCKSEAAADPTGAAPARRECLSEFSVSALVMGALGLSGLLWAAIFAVI